jgi:hypothetical protein
VINKHSADPGMYSQRKHAATAFTALRETSKRAAARSATGANASQVPAHRKAMALKSASARKRFGLAA